MKNVVKNAKPNGTVKQEMPNVQAVITKPVNDKPTEGARPSLEDRIQRVEELRGLTQKRHRAIDTLNQVRTFQFASDDNCVLTLVDGTGQKFQTNNSNLIGLLNSYFTTLLADKVSALDDEILTFKL